MLIFGTVGEVMVSPPMPLEFFPGGSQLCGFETLLWCVCVAFPPLNQ